MHFGNGAGLDRSLAAIQGEKNPHLLWTIFFLTAGSYIAWSYFNHRFERFSSAWLQLPIREAKLTLSGKRIYHDTDRFGQISGLAHVIHAQNI